ncbi:MAG: GNAT family N-acetyltransferase [Pseudomonadota bacterium]
MSVEFIQASEDDIETLKSFYSAIGKKQDGYFETLFEKDCLVLMAKEEKQVIAFGILNFEPKYSLYKKLEIPEIQDLNVHPDYRQRGIATALIENFEQIATDQGSEAIGISVGLTKDYGPAQRLYFKLGYMPDGNGITYDREGVNHGESVTLNDHACLMMLKDI